MIKLYTLLLCIVLSISGFSQNNGFKYQAIIRDAAGNVNANASVNIEISILQGTADGTVVFTELHAVTSNQFGLVNLTIGSQNPNGFELIDWANGPYFIKIVVDGVVFGTSQLLSVPYALHAKTTEKATLAETAENYTETDPVFTNSTAATITQTQIENWNNKLSEFTETDPDFNSSVAADITQAQIEEWTNKLGSFLETDPEFAASLAKGITENDTTYWNSKLDDFVESDPSFLAHPSAGITEDDITRWKALWIWYTTNAYNYQKISDDGDVDSSNELQALSISNDTIFLEEGGVVKIVTPTTTTLDKAYDNGRTIIADTGAFTVAGYDGIILTGEMNSGSNLTTIANNKPTFLYYPKKGVFRVGVKDDDSWNLENLGDWSTAFGVSTEASGSWSTAFGDRTVASGDGSIAIGYKSEATGDNAFVAGVNTTASGFGSIASGESTQAVGKYSVALGYNTIAPSYGCVVIGKWNETTTGDAVNWNPPNSSTEPVFIIGNGINGGGFENDALIVYRNGNMKIDGTIYPAVDDVYDLGILGVNNWSTVYAINGVSTSSDERLKSNILNINYGLKDILKLRPVSFSWKSKPEQGIKLGLVAQEVQTVITEIVDVGSDEDHTLSLRYADLIPVLIKSIQEQQEIIEDQNKKNKELENQLKEISEKLILENNDLKKRLEKLEKLILDK